MKFDTLETKKLILRKLTQEVYDHIYTKCEIDVQMRLLGLGTISELDTERLKYTQGLSMFNKDFLIFQLLDKAGEKIIGWCGYHTWYKQHERAEIGYSISDDKFKRKGIMAEALSSVIEYGFSIMKLNRIEAFIGPNNMASIK